MKNWQVSKSTDEDLHDSRESMGQLRRSLSGERVSNVSFSSPPRSSGNNGVSFYGRHGSGDHAAISRSDPPRYGQSPPLCTVLKHSRPESAGSGGGTPILCTRSHTLTNTSTQFRVKASSKANGRSASMKRSRSLPGSPSPQFTSKQRKLKLNRLITMIRPLVLEACRSRCDNLLALVTWIAWKHMVRELSHKEAQWRLSVFEEQQGVTQATDTRLQRALTFVVQCRRNRDAQFLPQACFMAWEKIWRVARAENELEEMLTKWKEDVRKYEISMHSLETEAIHHTRSVSDEKDNITAQFARSQKRIQSLKVQLETVTKKKQELETESHSQVALQTKSIRRENGSITQWKTACADVQWKLGWKFRTFFAWRRTAVLCHRRPGVLRLTVSLTDEITLLIMTLIFCLWHRVSRRPSFVQHHALSPTYFVHHHAPSSPTNNNSIQSSKNNNNNNNNTIIPLVSLRIQLGNYIDVLRVFYAWRVAISIHSAEHQCVINLVDEQRRHALEWQELMQDYMRRDQGLSNASDQLSILNHGQLLKLCVISWRTVAQTSKIHGKEDGMDKGKNAQSTKKALALEVQSELRKCFYCWAMAARLGLNEEQRIVLEGAGKKKSEWERILGMLPLDMSTHRERVCRVNSFPHILVARVLSAWRHVCLARRNKHTLSSRRTHLTLTLLERHTKLLDVQTIFSAWRGHIFSKLELGLLSLQENKVKRQEKVLSGITARSRRAWVRTLFTHWHILVVEQLAIRISLAKNNEINKQLQALADKSTARNMLYATFQSWTHALRLEQCAHTHETLRHETEHALERNRIIMGLMSLRCLKDKTLSQLRVIFFAWLISTVTQAQYRQECDTQQQRCKEQVKEVERMHFATLQQHKREKEEHAARASSGEATLKSEVQKWKRKAQSSDMRHDALKRSMEQAKLNQEAALSEREAALAACEDTNRRVEDLEHIVHDQRQSLAKMSREDKTKMKEMRERTTGLLDNIFSSNGGSFRILSPKSSIVGLSHNRAGTLLALGFKYWRQIARDQVNRERQCAQIMELSSRSMLKNAMLQWFMTTRLSAFHRQLAETRDHFEPQLVQAQREKDEMVLKYEEDLRTLELRVATAEEMVTLKEEQLEATVRLFALSGARRVDDKDEPHRTPPSAPDAFLECPRRRAPKSEISYEILEEEDLSPS